MDDGIDATKLSYQECEQLGKAIVVNGNYMLFLSNANRIFGEGHDGVSHLYATISAGSRNLTTIEIMTELLRQLCQHPNWARSALLEALMHSNLVQVAKKWYSSWAPSSTQLGDLSCEQTVAWLTEQVDFSNDLAMKLQAQEVNGKFLKEIWAQGELIEILRKRPFNFPMGTCSRIDSAVKRAIQDGVTVKPASREQIFSIQGSAGQMANTNPLVMAMKQQEDAKTKLASALFTTSDVALKKLMTQLMLVLGRDSAWLKFANMKGATSANDPETAQKVEKYLSDVQATGEPETFVVPAIANSPGYLATAFLEDLRSLQLEDITKAVDAIFDHFVLQSSMKQAAGDAVTRVNSSIRQWIVENELCDISSQAEIQTRLDAIRNKLGVTCMSDLKEMREEHFRDCGFPVAKAIKAAKVAKEIK